MVVRILIVDPQPFFCASLAHALHEAVGIETVGWATDEVEAARLSEEREPDVVLTEIGLASGSGLSLVRRLRDSSRVVVLTRLDPGVVLLDAVNAGAEGCVGHGSGVASLREALSSPDGFVVDPLTLGSILRRAASVSEERSSGASRVRLLTTREQEVLRLVAEGLDNAAIGARLYLSPDTVRTHLNKIFRKLDVHSRAEAARVALREGIGPDDADVLQIFGPELN